MRKLIAGAFHALRKTCGFGSLDVYLSNTPFTRRRIEILKKQKQLKDKDIYRLITQNGKEDVLC